MDEEDYEAYSVEETKAQTALQAIQAHKATLQEARWKQRQIKLGRKFFPAKPFEKTQRSGDYKKKGTVECFRCGGPHFKDKCPLNQGKQAHTVEEAAEIAFGAERLEEVHQTQEPGAVVKEVMQKCMGIIDSGATASLGSVDAMEYVMKHNLLHDGDTKMNVNTEQRPVFRFGNGGRKECLSTVQMAVDAGPKKGSMEVHIHDAPEQPVLVSRRALAALGAVIDFQSNQAIYTKVDPSVVVPLSQAPNGHLLMPLTGNILSGGTARKRPFQGFLDDE